LVPLFFVKLALKQRLQFANGGLGVRRRLYADKRMELFAEGRYHYIASGFTDFGQISLFPVSAGIRW